MTAAEDAARGTTESEPDARFTFANERTFLAWNRTALALIVAGLAVTQFVTTPRWPGASRAAGVVLIVLGAFLAIASYRKWQRTESALRRGAPVPTSRLPWLLTAGISLGAVIAVLLALFAATQD